MERDGNYILVGSFICMVVVFAFLWVFWITEDTRKYEPYVMYFPGSVMGLSTGAKVSYMGVLVGRVKTATVSAENPGLVRVRVDIEFGAPVSPSTVASLAMKGVTGLVMIELDEVQRPGEENGPEFKVDSEGLRIIAVRPSLIGEFTKTMPKLIDDADKVMGRIYQLISDDNVKNISSTIAGLAETTDMLVENKFVFEELLVNMNKTVILMGVTLEEYERLGREVGPQIKVMLANLHRVAGNAEKMTQQVEQLLDQNKGSISNFMGEGLDGLTELISESKTTVAQAHALLESLRANPSQLIYQPESAGVRVTQ